MANLINANSNQNYFQFHESHYKYETGEPLGMSISRSIIKKFLQNLDGTVFPGPLDTLFSPEKCDLNSTCILCAYALYAFCWVIPWRLNFKCRRSDHSVCSIFIGR